MKEWIYLSSEIGRNLKIGVIIYEFQRDSIELIIV